ncbi:hypothetical protein [Hymenobacter rubidus]|uniref:hypothetical protein n=1 Tax=Hymenobacter rubidus TaxID=1441626 RepID=UPI00191E8F69|nr:hypothetical protein [Hymenobacter rubidus]
MRYPFFLPLALLLGCATTDQTVVETPTVATEPTVQRAFDVPALLGLNANEIARPLISQSIRPDHDQTPRASANGTTEALYTYWRDTTALEVSYDPATLRVNSFFVKTKSGHAADYTTLLKLANVSKFDKRFSIEPMSAVDNPKLYTGVKIVPVRSL